MAFPEAREDVEQAVLAFLSREDYRPVPQRELLHRMHVPSDARPRVRRALKELLQDGRIARLSGNRYALAVVGRVLRGRLEQARPGFGFVVPEEGGRDVFVPARHFEDAVHGDVVAVRITGEDDRGRLEGAVVEVLDRRGRTVLGRFRETGGGAGAVDPFERGAPAAIPVAAADRGGARDGEAVVLEVRAGWGGSGSTGAVVEVLGPLDKPGVDTRVVARRHGLPLAFPEEVLRAAGRLPEAVPPEVAAGRERFDDPAPVTIDGETARDFDDAIAVAARPGGGFRLWVHIADVAHFVLPGDPLDREARARGTSVYFPDRVLPMFPEALSNDLCSLRPGEDRLVQTVVLDLDARAEVTSVRFADGVIRSAARLTYTQVAAVLEAGEERRRVAGVPPVIVPMLRVADRLREALERRRRARGSVDFDLPEPRILLDVEGVMTGITVEPRNTAHRLIEECMLAANEAVAGWLAEREAPCLYRIHEKPDPLKLEALDAFVHPIGLALRVDPQRITPKDVQALLDQAEGKPEYAVVAQVALRSMRQARYSEENVGHFGLAAPVYCHFTSPIRRYPDLVVHRFLRAARHGKLRALTGLAAELPALGESCSQLERTAETAERELLEWKKIAFMRGREGEIFEGIVTGVAPFGLFLQLTETLVEGLLRVEHLGGDRFTYDAARQELRAERGSTRYGLGQPLQVLVQRVDSVLRRVDLALEGEPVKTPAPRPRPRGRGEKEGKKRARRPGRRERAARGREGR
ncbi:MAG TPA: ribonuclease R [Candidatus Polarisedimenticolaceae bacterium]|nr:ribonuclease R [Candidatus Polarisedimenticolaceae bacterium]